MRQAKYFYILIAIIAMLMIIGQGCGSDNGDSAADGDTDKASDGDQSDGDQTDGDSSDGDTDGDTDGDSEQADQSEDGDSDDNTDGDEDTNIDGDTDGDVDGDIEDEGDKELSPVDNLTPPPAPATEPGYEAVPRPAKGTAPTEAEITAFTKKVTAFFKDTAYFDWVWRHGHGIDKTYDDNMMEYKLWWQDVSMKKEGDTIVYIHGGGRAENITKRTIKVMDNAIAGYLLTGDERMADLAEQFMKGIVALSIGFENERENPLVKYLQPRAIFTHNHSYEVDGRKVRIDYDTAKTASFKWNVHVFNLPDNPMYGDIWVSNMRSKDDVPYMFMSLPIVTRAYHEAQDEDVKAAAELYIEYLRGFSQSIVDNDWYILTRYEDGITTKSRDYTKESKPEADLGSFVHWIDLLGPDAECNAQLACAMTGYGYDAGKGDCDQGMIGLPMENMATNTHYFNYNIYNYFHLAAYATTQLWGHWDIAKKLADGLAVRYDKMMYDETLANRDHKEFGSDTAAQLMFAATHGYQLTADEAKYIMDWYGQSSDWYRQWQHWDPWASMTDGESFSDYKAPRDEDIDDGEGGTIQKSYVRLVEMPYIFEYCLSDIKHSAGVEFIDCDIVADPSQWGE